MWCVNSLTRDQILSPSLEGIFFFSFFFQLTLKLQTLYFVLGYSQWTMLWCVWMCYYSPESESCLVVSNSLWPYSPWNSPGCNTGVGSLSLLLQQRDSATHTPVSILPHTPFPSMLAHNIDQSSMCYTIGPYWSFILNIRVCTCPSQTPYLSLPLPRKS